MHAAYRNDCRAHVIAQATALSCPEASVGVGVITGGEQLEYMHMLRFTAACRSYMPSLVG